MNNARADVIVIGGGTMGTAAGWALARRGHKVIVLERFHHIHNMGSHSGHTRIFRHAYFEGESYVPWTLQADRAWSDLQERTGITLMHRCGHLDIAAPGSDHVQKALQSVEKWDIPHEALSGKDVNKRFPAWTVPSDWEACFDPEAGIIVIEPALRAMVTEFRAAGGELHENEQVIDWGSSSNGVTVTTTSGTYEADRLVVTAGAWSSKLLADLELPLTVTRKPVMWFNVTDRRKFGTDQFPTFVADNGQADFYGVPAYGGDSLKMGIHHDGEVVDPDAFNRNVEPDDLSPQFRDFVASAFDGVLPELTATAMCMYTMTPDEDFIIDRHPYHDRVSFAAGFSGHGFKFTPVVGEELADLATGDRVTSRADFSLQRFASRMPV